MVTSENLVCGIESGMMATMRGFICTDYEGQLFKVVWFTEGKMGVSVGYYDKKIEVHSTYHTDGAVHVKINGEKVPGSFSKKCAPIKEIQNAGNITGGAVSYSGKFFSLTMPFQSYKRADVVALMSHAIWKEIGAMAFNASIVSSKWEHDFLRQQYNDYQDKSFDLVSVNLFQLDHFPNHKIAIVFYRGKAAKTGKQ